MKTTSIFKFLFLIFLFHFTFNDVHSQVFDRRGQAIYVELMGNGLIYSVNYESRFSAKTGGLGGRIGISHVGDWLAVPVQLNFLIGKKDSNKFFEIGGGVTYIKYTEPFEVGDRTFEQQTLTTLSFMFRRHPRYGKWMWKVGLTPLIGYLSDDDEGKAQMTIWPWIGIGIGRAF
jgi:hypothetical protein